MSRRSRILDTNRTFSIQNPIKDSIQGNVFRMTKNSISMYKSQLYTLVFTNVGERLMLPEFGTNIQALLFEPMNDNIYVKLKREIQQAADRWIPGINIDDIRFKEDLSEIENNRITLSIDFSLKADSNVRDQIEIEKSI